MNEVVRREGLGVVGMILLAGIASACSSDDDDAAAKPSSGGSGATAGSSSSSGGKGGTGQGGSVGGTPNAGRGGTTPRGGTTGAGATAGTSSGNGGSGQGGSSASGGSGGDMPGGSGETGQGGTGTGGTGGTGGDTGGDSGSGGTPQGELLFVGDFETGDLTQWPYVEQCEDDRITVYSESDGLPGAPAPRQGQFAARFHVIDSDVAPCTSSENPRAEVETSEKLFVPGDEVWEAWSAYVPTSHPEPNCTDCDQWFGIQEDYGAPWDGSPSIGWVLDFVSEPPRFRMDRGAQYGHDQPASGEFALGRWVDFLVHKRFSNTDDDSGWVEAWVDGEPLTFAPCDCTHLVMQTMHSTQPTVGFYLNQYRASGFLDTFDTYYDGVRIGTTREIVELE